MTVKSSEQQQSPKQQQVLRLRATVKLSRFAQDDKY
jgi:hypothetical protein